MRNLAELKNECTKHNLSVVRAGKREAKADYEKALRNFFWQRDFPGRTMPPQFHPMLARNIKDVEPSLADFMWESPRYIGQKKVDGCRLLMFFGHVENVFTSRRISDKTYRYAENTEQVPHLSTMVIPELVGTVLDGEVVSPKACVNTGEVVTLNGLQATVALLALNPTDSVRIQREQDCRLIYQVFDILQHKGKDVTGLPLRKRLELLRDVMFHVEHEKGKSPYFVELPYTDSNKRSLYNDIVKEGGEGIMIKDLEAPYSASSSRTKAMFKVKRFEEVDGFVTGFQPGEPGSGWSKVVGGLEISAYDETTGELHAVAWVTNLTFEQRVSCSACPHCGEKLAVSWENQAGKRVITQVSCHTHGEVLPALHSSWFNRVMVVRGQELTARVLRLKHAVIISERNDKAPEECTIPLAMWRAKFASKAEETDITL